MEKITEECRRCRNIFIKEEIQGAISRFQKNTEAADLYKGLRFEDTVEVGGVGIYHGFQTAVLVSKNEYIKIEWRMMYNHCREDSGLCKINFIYSSFNARASNIIIENLADGVKLEKKDPARYQNLRDKSCGRLSLLSSFIWLQLSRRSKIEPGTGVLSSVCPKSSPPTFVRDV